MTDETAAQTKKRPTFDHTYHHEEGLTRTETRDVTVGGPRVHLSGNPDEGWIGEIHDGTQTFTASPEATSVHSALDELHSLYQKAGNKAIQLWNEVHDSFEKVLAAARKKAQEAADAARKLGEQQQGAERAQQAAADQQKQDDTVADDTVAKTD